MLLLGCGIGALGASVYSPGGRSMAIRPRTACPEGKPCPNDAQHVVFAHITSVHRMPASAEKMVARAQHERSVEGSKQRVFCVTAAAAHADAILPLFVPTASFLCRMQASAGR